MKLHPISEPELPAFLHELPQAAWEALNTLYWRNRPLTVDEDVRASLEEQGLVGGTELTELGQLAHDHIHRYLGEWDYSEDGKTWKSCAVIASHDEEDVLLHAMGPAIDWHIGEFGADLELLGLAGCSPGSGIWVWEGGMGSIRINSPATGVEYEHSVTGDWRELTVEEWAFVKDGECPWTKETLPKWKKNDG